MNKIEASLHDLKQLGCILQRSTGVIYSNQTGGYACRQPKAEGVFIFLDENIFLDGEWRSPMGDISKHFTGEKYNGWSEAAMFEGSGIDTETGDFIEERLRYFGLKNILVNREKLKDSEEAWVHVIYYGEPAILTWENSD